MKKLLLCSAAFFAALTISAQVQVVTVDGKAWATANGSTDEGASAWGPIAGGVEICKIDGCASMANGADTNYKIAGSQAADFDAVDIDGVLMEFGDLSAVQGQDNTKDEEGNTGWSTFKKPVTGAFTTIKADKDGYLAVVAKYSSNKNYTVFEEGTCIPYIFAMEWSDGVANGAPASANPLTYTLPGVDVGEGIIAYDQSNGPIQRPEQIVLGAESGINKNGVGVIIFPVYGGCIYNCNAWGSKIAPQGMFFYATPFQKVTVCDKKQGETPKDDFVIYNADPAGINSAVVDVNTKLSKAFCNIAGQQVGANYKGLVIKNGKKLIKK